MSERSIVIAYEDDYCDELHRLLKALRRDLGQSGVILEARPVKGTGQFVNEVPKLLRERLKQTKRPPDRVVCVADADKPTSLVPDAKSAPTTTDLETLQRWVCDFEASWLNHLKREGRLQEESAMRLQAVCLRWNKESLLIASLDALRAYAAERDRSPEVDGILRECIPAPETVPAEEFVSRYRDPIACMGRLIHVVEKRNYKKGRDDEDLLKKYITPNEERRKQLLAKCPDLMRLLGLLNFTASDTAQ